jgi:hypothetical protein
VRRGRGGTGGAGRQVRLPKRRGLLALLLGPFLFAYVTGVSAHADLAAMPVAPGLVSVSGVAQCGGTSLPGAKVQLFSGATQVATTTADATGQYVLPPAAAGLYTLGVSSGATVCGYQLTLTPTVASPAMSTALSAGGSLGTLAINTKAGCQADSRNNHSWITASALDALSSTPAPATVDECLYRQDQSAWFKIPIQPGSKVVVNLTNLPANYDLTLYKDIAAAYQGLAITPASLTRLSAEFPSDGSSSDAYAPDAYSPDAYSPDAYSPDAYSPDAYSPDAYSPDAYSPDAYSPDAYSPDAYSPDGYSSGAYRSDSYSPAMPMQNALTGTALAGTTPIPAAYSSAQTRSLIGVSAHDGTASESIVRNTWDNTTNVYVRVRGRNGVFSLAQPFHLAVTVLTAGCSAVSSVASLTAGTAPSLLSGTAGSYDTIILWDSSRASRLAGWSANDLSAVAGHLNSLAAQTAGVVVDVGQDAQVKAANLVADAATPCAFAKNLVGLEIKRIIDSYRSVNPLKYIVIVGDDSLIPFFRHPDQAGLANERNFVPPVYSNSPSQASLNLGYFWSQDRYGSSIALSVGDHTLPLPDLPVGRLIEKPSDINGVIDAYLGAPAGGITPTTSLATGYDFFADAATAIAGQLSAGTNHPTDTLIQSSGPPTVAGGAWTADQLRAKLFGARHDVMFLGAHFSAFSAEAADFSTHLLANEVANSTVDMSNVIVFSEGCHSGYNTVDGDALPIPLIEPDFPQAFASKHATLIGGSGYQYGDTDFIQYGERLYLEFSKQLRTGGGPVSVGQALLAAKQAYLRDTPQWSGIHEKTMLEATLYGLPQLMVNMPGARLTPVADTSVVNATSPSTSNPGSLLGLSTADLTVQSSLTPHTVKINSTTSASAPLTATYLSGSNGQVANPNEPVMPLEMRPVAAPAPAAGVAPTLRGVGFRGGSYTDNPTGGPVVPLTDAPATEQRGLHSLFSSSVMYPVLPWRVNYFDALTGGGSTRLDVTPAQYQSSGPASQTGTLRAYSSMNFRLYYSDPLLSATTYGQTAGYAGNIPALAAAPAISRVSATPSADGLSLAFRVNVEGDPSAGIQQVWVTYTAVGPACSGGVNPCAGQWQPLDLVQDGSDSTLWTSSLPLGATGAGDVRYMVQAVNGVGVVGTATNMGAYYVPRSDTVAPTAPKQSTSVSFSSAPSGGSYRDQASFTAALSSNGSPVSGRPLVFAFGPQRLQAVTDSTGSATVTFPLLQAPGQYSVQASFEEAQDLLGSAAESAFTITRQNTTITFSGGSAHYSDPTAVVATLADQSATSRRLREQTVFFVVSQGQSSWVVLVITDELGRAPLGSLPLAPGSYTVAAYFSGTIPIPTSTGIVPLTLTNDRYNASTATLGNGLTITPEPATVAYTGDTIDSVGGPINLGATLTQETDDAPGDITNAQVAFAIKDASGTIVGQTTAPVAADGTSSTSIPSLPAGRYRIESSAVGSFYTSPTTTVPLIIFDPSLWVTGSGTVPTTMAAPNDTATVRLKVKYDSGATRPTGKLRFKRGVPGDPAPVVATSPPAVATPAPTPTSAPSPSPAPAPAAVAVTPTPAPDPVAVTPVPAPTPATEAPVVAPSPTPDDDLQVGPGNPCAAVDPNGPIDFKASGFDWLVISGSTVQFEGTGTLNGCSGYRVRVIATHIPLGADIFEIHIWDAAHSFDAPLVLVAGTMSSGGIQIKSSSDPS